MAGGTMIGAAPPGAMAAGILLPAATIAMQVAANAADLNPLDAFDAARSLVGRAATPNPLLDLQWHLLSWIALLPAGLLWLPVRPVRVDVIGSRPPPRGRSAVDPAASFPWRALPASWSLAAQAWRLDEGSADCGFVDLRPVKGVLPPGPALLAGANSRGCVRLASALPGRCAGTRCRRRRPPARWRGSARAPGWRWCWPGRRRCSSWPRARRTRSSGCWRAASTPAR